jgi:hypothetical protein
MIEVHGKRVVIIGGRCFAVRKSLDNAERIANQSQGHSNYQRAVSNIPNPRLRNTRSIKA